MFEKIFPFFFVIALSYWAIQPFFLAGFFPMHDDTQVERVFEMHKALSDGMFPVRWVADLGYHYGYPIFNFYAPLAYYVGALFMFFGLNALVATKTMMALGVLLSGIFMYFLAKEFWGRAGGIISALLYVYAPYHAVNIFVRGDVAEFWAYAFIPLSFLGIYKIYLLLKENPKLKIEKLILPIIIGSLGYVGIILSHNLSAMMVSPFLFLFTLILSILTRRKIYIFTLVTPLLLGIVLAAFYWLPVFAEMQYTNVLSQVGGGSDYKDHFVCAMQLWDSPWGFGGSTPTCIDGMSFMVGKIHSILFILGLLSLWLIKTKEKKKFAISLFFIFGVGFAIFLLLPISKFIWDNIRQMALFQFPWRFLLVGTFFICLSAGSLVLLFKNLPVIAKRGAFIGIVFCIIFFNIDIFVPQIYFATDSVERTNIYHLWWKTSKISDEYMPKDFKKPNDFTEVPKMKIENQDGVRVLSLKEQTQQIIAKIEVEKPTNLLINHAYYPGWQILLDNKKIDFIISDKGLIIAAPEGLHTLRVVFSQTMWQKIGNSISLAGVFILLLGIIKLSKSKKHEQKTT